MSTTPATDRLEGYPLALLRAVDAAFEGWYLGRLNAIASTRGAVLDGNEAAGVSAEAAHWVRSELAAFLAVDVDEQRTNPLHLLRSAARFATDLLDSAGAVRPVRDEFESRSMPDDVFAVGPLAWVDLGDDVHEAGISWGAWKAATVLSRRRAEGKID
ncbi:MAG: hypothetical protein ACKORY_12300 [Actinomycetota bacterium]